MLPVPAAAGNEEIDGAFMEVARKKAPEALPFLRVEPWAEGRSAQTLHVGSYATELPTIAALHAAVAEARLRPRGCHHEIYISDPNRTAPDRLKTIIRQPVEPDADVVRRSYLAVRRFEPGPVHGPDPARAEPYGNTTLAGTGSWPSGSESDPRALLAWSVTPYCQTIFKLVVSMTTSRFRSSSLIDTRPLPSGIARLGWSSRPGPDDGA
jgi:GyrI-like small molecule binding domain